MSWRRLLHWWDKLEQIVVGLLGAFALLAGAAQVLGRYIMPEHAITWADEAIVYLIVWAVMIISSQLVKTDGHVRPDLVLRLLPPTGQRIAEIFNSIIALAFSLGMIWYGWQIVALAQMLDQRSPSDLQFPMWIYDAALPAGGLLMAMRYTARLLRYLFAYDPATMTIGHVIHERPLDMPPLNVSETTAP